MKSTAIKIRAVIGSMVGKFTMATDNRMKRSPEGKQK